jgi:hypothetical protein
MDNSKPNLPEPEPEAESESQIESQPDAESEPKIESQPDAESESQIESKPDVRAELSSYVNEKIKKAYDRTKSLIEKTRDNYNQAPKIQKVVYQRKFFPAFWTVASIFSLIVNVILIAILISVGHNLFELKAIVADGLVTPTSNNLELMDKAHIITMVPVETTVRLQDSLPVVFDLPIDKNLQLSTTEDTRISGAYIYLNNTAVETDLTLPARTPLQANFNLTIPVSTTVPVDLLVPVTVQVPVDIAVNQTDLHQSIVGLQGAIEPYQKLMGTSFNSPKDLAVCNNWMTGWLCSIVFGK